MSNWIDVHIFVLSSSPEEINRIEAALQEPCEELLDWVSKKWDKDPKEIAADVKGLVSFKPKRNLGSVNASLNQARLFDNEFKDKFWGVVWSHVDLVSRDFPHAIFLAHYWDSCMSYSAKVVIRAGHEIRFIFDGSQKAQGYDWVLPDIFAPFWSEYNNDDDFGSHWHEWVNEMGDAIALLKKSYGAPNLHELQNDDPTQEAGSDNPMNQQAVLGRTI